MGSQYQLQCVLAAATRRRGGLIALDAEPSVQSEKIVTKRDVWGQILDQMGERAYDEPLPGSVGGEEDLRRGVKGVGGARCFVMMRTPPKSATLWAKCSVGHAMRRVSERKARETRWYAIELFEKVLT